jgi:predicted transcriptional regulator
MTTATIPVVALEEHLLTQGPSKAAVLAKAIHMSETATRKMLKRLEGEGKVVKDGQLFAWVNSGTSKDKTRKSTSIKRDDVRARDVLVLTHIQLWGDEGTSRATLVKQLADDGHALSGSFVYLSLFRLHAAGEIERVHVGKRAPYWRAYTNVNS